MYTISRLVTIHKALFLLWSGCLVYSAFAQSTYTHPDLRMVLLSMEAIDEEIRSEIIEKGVGNLDTVDFTRQLTVDETLTKILLRIVEEYGWPTSQMVGKDAVYSAFLIVQHAEYEVQKSMLENIRVSYEIGDLDGGQYALLYDRVQTAEGLPQRYGSQAEIRNGEIVFFPMEDVSRVDEFRSQVGLEPIRDYIKRLEEFYGVVYRGNLK